MAKMPASRNMEGDKERKKKSWETKNNNNNNSNNSNNPGGRYRYQNFKKIITKILSRFSNVLIPNLKKVRKTKNGFVDDIEESEAEGKGTAGHSLTYSLTNPLTYPLTYLLLTYLLAHFYP